jgi:cardiolipin synthase
MDFASWGPTLVIVFAVLDFLIRLTCLVYVPRNRRPQTATAWLLAIFFLPPYIGVTLFLLLGSRRLPKARRDKQTEVNSFITETTEGIEEVKHDHPWLDPVVELNRHLGAMPLVGGNQAKLYGTYDETLVAMTEAINNATKWVHAEFYILALDRTTAPFFDALEAAVKRGVTVRVLLDHVAGVRAVGYRRTKRRLRKAGVQWSLMLPVQPWRGKWQRPDLRNHRKILVLDGNVAFTGSQNVVDSSYNKKGNLRRGLHWKDLMVRFEGPIVAGVNALFITDWYTETNELLMREASTVPRPRVQNSLDAQVVPSGIRR